MSIRPQSVLTLLAAVVTSTTMLSSTAFAAGEAEPVVVTAQRQADEPTEIVSHRDLRLTLAADQRRLDRRVEAAVKNVCGYNDTLAARTVASFSHYHACHGVAWSGARPQIAAAVARASDRLAGGSDVAETAIIVSSRSAE
jgi:UrcA family protein